MAESSTELTPRKTAAVIAGIGVFLAVATFVAGELDRLYSGDHGFWRAELVLVAYAGLWFPCVALLGIWQGRRIFGSVDRYYDFNRELKTAGPQSGLDLGLLRRVIRFRRWMSLLDLLQGLVNLVVAAALAFGSPFHHWVTSAWFTLGAFVAFNDVRRSRGLTRRLATELRTREPASR